MPLSEILKKEAVLLNLKAEDRFEAIKKLVQALVRAGVLAESIKPIVEYEVIEREKLLGTGMEHGVAVPHGLVDGVDSEVAAFAKADTPIDFEAQDGAPVDLIFLLIIPPGPTFVRVRRLSEIVRLLHQERIRQKIREANTVEEIYELFK